jgi:hypothetical protein
VSARERQVDAWFTRWTVHACLLAVLLVAALSVGVVARLDEAAQLPRDRPIPASPVQITGPHREPVHVPPADAPARTGKAPVAGE